MNHRNTMKQGIAPLKTDGISVIDPKGKADVLNKQFESVFTEEGPLDQGQQGTIHRGYPEMEDITITEKGVEKLLLNLNMFKAAGPDEIVPRILRELALVPALTTIFKKSYEARYLANGRERMQHLSTRRGTNQQQPTTGLFPSPVSPAKCWSISSPPAS